MPRPFVSANPRKRYHGKPCKHGHTERWKSNSACVECERERIKKRALLRERIPRAKNTPDKPKLCGYGCSPYEKPPSEFYLNKMGTLSTYCKACYKIYHADMWKNKYSRLGRKASDVLR